MVSIINGKKYSTETAKELGYNSYSNSRDSHYWCETLYQKKTGEFFLHGEGGPLTKYRKETGTNSYSGSEKIMPLAYEEARKWAEENLDADVYEEIFGEVSEDDDRTQMCISVPSSFADSVRKEASKEGRSFSDYIVANMLKYRGITEFYEMDEQSKRAIREAINNIGFEIDELTIAFWYADSTITINKCRNGRSVAWIMLENKSCAVYVDTLTVLDDEEIMEQLC